jgi:molybdenum cofactor guanylyltransferase
MTNNISGVILAGGSSKRLGGILKAGIVIDGKPIMLRIIETIGDIVDDLIIVTNRPEEFKYYTSCKIIRDIFPHRGPLGGIHSAMKESEREALFVFAGDMPLLDKEIIIRQIKVFKSINCDILIPKFNNSIEPLHGIYRKSLILNLEEYLNEGNNFAIREFLKKADVHYLQLEESEKCRRAFTNINSSSDLTYVKRLLGLKE